MRRWLAIAALLLGLGLVANAIRVAWPMLEGYGVGAQLAVPWLDVAGAVAGLALLIWAMVLLVGRAPAEERRLNLPSLTPLQWGVAAIYMGSAAANFVLVESWVRHRPSQPDALSGNVHPYWNHQLIYVSQSDLIATHALWVVTFVALITGLVMRADRKWPDPPER